MYVVITSSIIVSLLFSPLPPTHPEREYDQKDKRQSSNRRQQVVLQRKRLGVLQCFGRVGEEAWGRDSITTCLVVNLLTEEEKVELMGENDAHIYTYTYLCIMYVALYLRMMMPPPMWLYLERRLPQDRHLKRSPRLLGVAVH